MEKWKEELIYEFFIRSMEIFGEENIEEEYSKLKEDPMYEILKSQLLIIIDKSCSIGQNLNQKT